TAVRPGLGNAVKDNPSRPAIGAAVTVRLPDGRQLVAEVDGGTGFAGKRSPDVHFGLGQADEVSVEVRYRDPRGQLRQEMFSLKAGWHTIRLGWPEEGKGERS
ncbi:MAG: ASPIC/UnbV domain-containing protein, partial [Gemmataceae bacterium]|nr:ASPIC/UnbV domain-containing protein [Gemmataceae bacterium]